MAVALTQARINQDKSSPLYLTQILTGVYNYRDPRTYPLSSYSYMIVPTGADDQRMNENKANTLGDFAYYFLCDGQREAAAARLLAVAAEPGQGRLRADRPGARCRQRRAMTRAPATTRRSTRRTPSGN